MRSELLLAGVAALAFALPAAAQPPANPDRGQTNPMTVNPPTTAPKEMSRPMPGDTKDWPAATTGKGADSSSTSADHKTGKDACVTGKAAENGARGVTSRNLEKDCVPTDRSPTDRSKTPPRP